MAKWSREQKDGVRSQDQMDEDSITVGLADIFKLQAAEQEKKDKTEAAERNTDRTIHAKFQGGSLAYLRQITQFASRQVAYQDQVLVKFQQKQLELNYRQYFVQRQLLGAFKDHASVAKANLEVISKNTGLPDFVKMRNAEVIEQVLKTSTVASLTEGARDWFKNGTKRLLSHYKGQLKEFATTAGMVLETAQSGAEMMEGADKRAMALEMGGGGLGQYAAGKLADKLTPKLRELAEKNPKAVAWGLRLSNLNNTLPQKILDWVRDRSGEENSDSWWSRFIGSTKDGLGDFKKGTAIRTSAADKLDEAVHFNLQARQTLVEVIPGWLSRIHNEIRMHRTGNDQLQPMKYSFDSGSFEETGRAYRATIKRVFNKGAMTKTSDQLSKMMEGFEGADLTPEESSALAMYLFNRANDSDVGFSTDNLLVSDEAHGLDKAHAAEIKRKLRAFTGASITEKADRNGNIRRSAEWDMTGAGQARLSTMIRGFNELQSSLPNFQEILQKELSKGNQDALVDLGLIEYDETDSTWHMKVDFFREAVIDQYKRLTPEQQASPSAWSKTIRQTINNLQGAIAGKRPSKAGFATGGHVKGPKLRGEKPKKDTKFKQTGLIDGPGTGTSDSVDIKVSGDEFVVKAAKTREPGALGFLKDFNKSGMAAIKRWGVGFKSGRPGTADFMGPMPYQADPNEFVGPLQPEIKVKRTLTDLYDLIDDWAPVWAAGGTLQGGLNSLSRLGGKAKALFGRLDPRRLKAMGMEIDKDELKRQARQGLSTAEKALLTAKDKMFEFGRKGAEYGMSGLSKINSFRKWSFSQLKEKIPPALRNIKAAMDKRSARFKDIYVMGEDEPRLVAEVMINGGYRDRKTGKIIKSLADITGPVDDVHTGKVIISVANYKKGLYDKYGKPMLTRVFEKIKKTFNTATAPVKAMINTAKAIGLGAFRRLNQWDDVYVKGEVEPRLYARLLAEGKYFDKATRKPIYHSKDITGPVVDETGAVVLNKRDLKKGLVNQQGKPIGTLMKRVGSLAMAGMDMALGLGTRAAGFIWEKASKLGSWIAKVPGRLRGAAGKMKGMHFSLGFGSLINRPVVDKLEEIRLMLDERLRKPRKKASNDSDGDGHRDGSKAEQLQAREEAAEKKKQGRMASLLEKLAGIKEGAKEKAKGVGGGIMDMFSSMKGLFSSAASMFTGFTKFLPAATTMATVIGKLKNLPGMIGGAATAVKGALGKGGIVRSLASGAWGLAKGAVGLTGTIVRGAVWGAGAVLSSPALLTAAAVAVTGYAAYKLYKYATKEDDYILRWRMAQYGVDPDSEELVNKLRNVEALMLSKVQVSKNSTAKLGQGIKFGDVMSIFGVSDGDQEGLERLIGWFTYRFKPVFLSTVTIYYDITAGKRIDIQGADQTLTAQQAKDLVQKTHFPQESDNSPYKWGSLPFKDQTDVEVSISDINDLYKDTLEYIEDDAERYNKNAKLAAVKEDKVVKSERDKKQKEKEDTLWNRTKKGASDLWDGTSKKVGDAYNASKNAFGDALDKVKSWADPAKAWAAKSLKTGVKVAQGAWDWMKNAGTSVINASSAAIGDAVDIAKRVGKDIIPKILPANANQVMNALLTAAKATGIASNPTTLAMFLAQMYHESGGFRSLQENLNYKTDTLMKISKRAMNAGRAAVDQVVKAGPVAIAEFMYGGRMGNDEPGDGWKYRGRGPTQLTGKDNYRAVSKALGIDLLNNPDLVADPTVGARVATWFWQTRVGKKGDSGDVTAVTKAINGGTIGLAERGHLFKEFGQRIASGNLSLGPAAANTETKGTVTVAPPLPKTTTGTGGKPTTTATPTVAAAPPSKTDAAIAQRKEAVAKTATQTATATKATATVATATDTTIQTGIADLIKVNKDQLAVLQSIDAKMERLMPDGVATAPKSASSTNNSTSKARAAVSAPVRMGSV